MFGSIISIGSSLLGGYLNNDAASDRQEDAQGFSAQQFATRYQTTVKDMKAAGLNPMLAYSQGGGNAPVSSAASSSGYPDIGSAFNQARLASANVANIEADTANKQAQAELIQAQIAHTYASADQAGAAADQARKTSEKITEEIKNIPQEGMRLVAATQQLREQASLMSQQSATQHEITKVQAQTLLNLRTQNVLTDRQILKIMEETKLLKYDVQAASDLGNAGRYVGQAKPVLDILRSLIGKGR